MPLLASPSCLEDLRFKVAGIHTRSQPAAPTVEAFLDQARADVLVELTTLNPLNGEPAISHIRAAFARNMHVVTANKGPIAHAYHELATLAKTRHLAFRFESSVMDGAPVFNQFRNNMPGVRVIGFAGVLNSTTNLVIETLERGGTKEEGLAYARRIGVAEADASYDMEGWDSAAKTAALANVLMDARITPMQVARSGIESLTAAHLSALTQEGKTIRLVSRAQATATGMLYSARAETLPRTDVLASGAGTSNMLLFHTDRMGTFGTVSIAPGVAQTAYGVYIDLLDIARSASLPVAQW